MFGLYDEKDHQGEMSFAAKFAWGIVFVVFVWVLMPALMMSTTASSSRQHEPVKHTYTVPLTCYTGADANGRSVLICDQPPMNPANPPH